MGMKICLMSHVAIIWLAHEHLMVVTFIFRVHVENGRVHVSSLDMMGCGMMWQRILLCSHGSLHGTDEDVMSWVHLKIQFALNSNVLQIENKFNKIIKIVLFVTFDVLDGFS